MLIHFTTSIKTTLILLLFTIGGFNSYAGITPTSMLQKDTITTGKNTAKQEGLQSDVFIIPENARKATINFQVNSEINYLTFSHFVKDESRKIFYKAWMDESEVRRLSAEADSLRKSYANSPNDQKEIISTRILQTEKRLISLNEEIPALYEKVRTEENQYWQSASHDDVIKFQAKVRTYQDSIQQINTQQSKKTHQDTITYYQSKPKTIVNTEPVSTIIYKIQVGAFKGKMSETAAKSIKKLSILRKVENYKDEKGLTVYTTGSLKSYREAVTMQSQIKLEGIKNATIAAYNKGKRITVDEALKLTNESKIP